MCSDGLLRYTVEVTVPHATGYIETIADVASFPKGFVESHSQKVDAIVECAYYEVHLKYIVL